MRTAMLGVGIIAILTALAGGLPPAAQGADEPKSIHGSIEAVTVYRGQALVTRAVTAPGPAGLHEIVVSDLPERVLPGSIFAESVQGVEIRSVRYRVRPVAQDVRAEIRDLDVQLRATQDALAVSERNSKVIEEQWAYLNKLEAFTAPTADIELSKGVLNAQTIKDLTTFQFAERQKLAETQQKLQFEQRDLREKIELLTRERAVLAGSSGRSVQEAVVFINILAAQGGKFHLRYLVDAATWSPSYNVRTDAKREKVQVEYNASIEQMSGEDWTNVSMTLSTATPSLVARAPALDPLVISLHEASQGVGYKGKDYDSTRSELSSRLKSADTQRQQREVPQQQGAQVAGQPQMDLDEVLNTVAGELQVLDLTTDAKFDRPRPKVGDSKEGLSITYELAGRTSLPSRADRQLIQIAALDFKGDFYKVATPVLTEFVFEEAQVTNTGSRVLLAGPCSAYVAGQFVGQGEVPTVAVGQSFVIGLGIDSSLRATRELVTRQEQIQGGNRVLSFTYRLAIENFGAAPAKVRLVDRLPSTDQSQIRVTLTAPGPDLSNDMTYQTSQKKKGILRWEVDVPAQAIGPTAFALEYQFQVEYDKQLTVAGLPLKR